MKPRLFNHYEILRRLGAGGAGVVYSANDTKLMRPVVLKMLHRGSASDDEVRRRILREARLASAIDHPNVCSIYEVDESDGQAVIVMQFVPGRTLDRVIDAGPLGLPLALSIAIQIGDGLAEAHRLGIVHRDLKPSNVMLTDGGLVKILDFGTARRAEERALAAAAAASATSSAGVPAQSAAASAARANNVAATASAARKSSTQRGTLAYMAPEQFVTGRSGTASDVFAFGVILYELLAGKHPFLLNPGMAAQLPRAIQYAEPPRLTSLRSDVPPEIERVVARAMAKIPTERYGSAAEMRDALRTVMRARHGELGGGPGEMAAALPMPEAERDKPAGLWSMLTERLMPAAPADLAPDAIAVLPFASRGSDEHTAFFGAALADAVASRLAREPSVVVRPASALLTASARRPDPFDAGRRLHAAHVVAGSYLRSAEGFELTWQLLDVGARTLRAGGTIAVPSLSLVAVQEEICEQVFAALSGAGHLGARVAPSPRATAVDEHFSEDYLQARALLSNFLLRSSQRSVLDAARARFSAVLERDPDFAPAHSGLGVAHLHAFRRGFGGLSQLMEAQRCFRRALERDSGLVEADLYRVEALLSRGEKESARHGIRRLLETAGNDFDVRVVAGVILQRDGLYDRALAEFGAALRLNPAGATVVYNNRARVHGYLGQLELARAEISKGLALEPKHALLRISLGYLHFRLGDLPAAIATLEGVLADEPGLKMLYPTLAMCRVVAGERAPAAELIAEDVLAAAEADCETAYRLATYFALDGETSEALHWLRRAIYLGNENYPWFARNPAWAALHENDDFQRVLAALKKTYRLNLQRWSQLLERSQG